MNEPSCVSYNGSPVSSSPPVASCSLNVATPGTFPGGQPAFPECWMFDGVTSPRPLWLLLKAPRPIVKVYCPSSTSDLCVHVCVLSFGKPRHARCGSPGLRCLS